MATIKEQSLLSELIARNELKAKEAAEDRVKALEEILNLSEQLHGNNKFDGKTVGQMKRDLADIAKLKKDQLDKSNTENKILKKNSIQVESTLDLAGKIGEKIKNSIESIPFIGKKLSNMLNLDDLSEKMQETVGNSLGKIFSKEKFSFTSLTAGFVEFRKGAFKGFNKQVLSPLGKMGPLGKRIAGVLRGAFKFAFGPVGLAIGAFAAIFTIVKKIRQANRDLADTLGVTTSEARKFQIPLKTSEMAFNAIGLDGSKLKTTMGEIAKEFGSLENMTIANSRNIERFAQNSGIAGTEIVKFNKVMMDLTGSSFSVATNMAETAANMAKSANVSTAKVLGDITSAAEDFARYSMSGAEGLAQAAVEAAKVGSSLSTTLKVADSLLSFEEAIGAQFKAQVLTGRQINTERARQLALDGDIAGLTQEIQSIVGGVGDLQTLNVIQRKSVAEAIGISVGELMRISRGEQVQQQVTVQDKLDITNKLLAKSNDEAGKFYATQQGTKKVEMQQPTF